MKKLKDLKENECIKLNTLKEAKFFNKKCGFDTNANNVLKYGFIVYEDNSYWYSNTQRNIVYLASDFIKSKRSNSKRIKRLESEVDRLSGIVNGFELKKPIVFEYSKGLDFTKELLSEPKELEVGKWYKINSQSKTLACFQEIGCNNYGFSNTGNWATGIKMTALQNWAEATKEDVESALIAEAKRRYKFGDKVKGARYPDSGEYIVKSIDMYDDYIVTNKPTNYLFFEGKWAEIIQEKEIDWSVPGQLLSSENGKVVLLYDGKHDKDTFNGTVIKGDVGGVGMYINKAYKNCYVKFNGSITLKNE